MPSAVCTSSSSWGFFISSSRKTFCRGRRGTKRNTQKNKHERLTINGDLLSVTRRITVEFHLLAANNALGHVKEKGGVRGGGTRPPPPPSYPARN